MGGSNNTTCALGFNGQAQCWGYNRAGQLTKGSITGVTNSSIGHVDPAYNLTPVTIKGSSVAGSVLQGIVEIKPGVEGSCALTATGKIKCWGRQAMMGSGGGGSYTLYPVDVEASVSDSEFVPGVRSSHYVCRKNFSRCVLSLVSLTPGGLKPNYLINDASPALRVDHLGDGETLTLYSDSACASTLSGGSLAGDSDSNPQTLSLSNSVTDREIFLYYKIAGHAEINDTLCFKSALVFDRLAPPAPSAVYLGANGPAEDATSETLSSLPTTVKVKVEVNSTDSVKEYGVEVYLENSTCDSSSDLVASGSYDADGTLDLSFPSAPGYAWEPRDTSPSASPVQPQRFKFYAKSIDAAENSSSCTESLWVWLPKPPAAITE